MHTPSVHGAMREHTGAGPWVHCPHPATRVDPDGDALGEDHAERLWCGDCATGAAEADAR